MATWALVRSKYVVLNANDNVEVMSAVSGLQGKIEGFGSGALVVVSIAILLVLFGIQKFETGKVAFMFVPILAAWFFSLGAVGLYNRLQYDIFVSRAVNPAYIYYFFWKNSKNAWSGIKFCPSEGPYCLDDHVASSS
ncbi:hypothetical protein MLD38_008539 [Melastoma candidum]|uniref:Uncharacterized protein n=1 Tax=Melastoma candidum TaxID=119954 RepID=A0ACB9RYD3_9MYRT|nr:hypothetical protein MLD38_008539 [Melastoma candidum]